jgi:hypothetical protein
MSRVLEGILEVYVFFFFVCGKKSGCHGLAPLVSTQIGRAPLRGEEFCIYQGTCAVVFQMGAGRSPPLALHHETGPVIRR